MHIGFPSRLLLLTVLLTVVLPLTFAQKNQELYVVERKPPSVVVVDRNTWQPTATIPLEGVPERVQFDGHRGMLYLLTREVLPLPAGSRQTMEQARVRLLLVDTAFRKVAANFELGVGHGDSSCEGTADEEHVICWSQFYEYQLRCESKNENDCLHTRSQLTVIDRQQDYRAATAELKFWIDGVAANSDATRIFLYGQPAIGSDHLLQLYGREAGTPSLGLLGQVSFRRLSKLLLSPDNQWLYVFSEGEYFEKTKKIENARMYVLDPKTLKVAAELPVGTTEFYGQYKLQMDADSGRVLLLTLPDDKRGELVLFNGTAAPMTMATGARPGFLRLSGEKGTWVTSKHELRFLPAGKDEFTARIPLASPAPPKVDVGGYPGPMIHLPQQRKAAMIVTDENYQPTAKIALIDLAQQRVRNVITTGRGGAKVAKFFQEFGGAMVMGAITSLTAPIGGGELGYYTPSRQAQLIAKADGSVIYALNTSTSDLTAINTDTGAVLGMFKVCPCGILSPTLNGRFILAHSTDMFSMQEDQVTWLDTTTNKTNAPIKFPEERVHMVAGMPQTNITLILTTHALTLWNSDTGELLRRTGTFNDVLAMAGPDVVIITAVPRPFYPGSSMLMLDIGSGK